MTISTTDVVDAGMMLWDRAHRLGLRLDPIEGLPRAVLMGQGDDEVTLPLALTVELVVDGDEAPRALGGLDYVETGRIDAFRRVGTPPRHELHGSKETYTVATEAGDWTVLWHYTFRQSHPRLEIGFTLTPTRAAGRATLRDVRLEWRFRPGDLATWRVEAPGNTLRPGVAADALTSPQSVSPVGGVHGSAGVVALHQPGARRVVVIWPFSHTEIGAVRLQTVGEDVRLGVDTGLAGRLSAGQSLGYGGVEIDALEGTWAEVRDDFPAWYIPLGVATPHDRADWIETASIFEVQIGYAVFWGGYRYAPYPTVRDLLADLGRIKGLGYSVLQIMPRQPYPSYNVHDYADVTTSYGDEEGLRALVAACHTLDMRVILDILLHGVIDQEVMARTAMRVRGGPYAARLAEDTSNIFSDADAGAISWSRHILDFEPHWLAGSPPRHPLADAHPEWFMRDSAQHIIGIYTKAFDVANVAWQEYFSAAAEELVRRLDIDGFRFDAPTYNDLPNWSTATERRASYSPLGSLELFARLRTRLKRVKPSIMLYTEPSGVLFRQAMDVTYNYDEQWLINAVLRPSSDERSRRLAVRNGRELAAWFRDRNAVLPTGSLIAHHVDSHDTFWWPLPGHKWRREQYGLAATRALLAIFALSGGAYMTFVGGEEGIEDEVRRVHRLRATLPEVGQGTANYDAVTIDHEAIYAVVRSAEMACTVVLVNMSDQPLETVCRLDTAQLGLGDALYEVYDAWNDGTLMAGEYDAAHGSAMGSLHLAFAAFQPRVLVIRPVPH